MDLAKWITNDHRSLRTKLFRSVIELVPTERWGELADGGGSSINHLLLHHARHQDLAVNVAIRNHPPLFAAHAALLGADPVHPAAGLAEHEDRALTATMPADALTEYVTAVFDATERWIQNLSVPALDDVPPASQRLAELAGVTTARGGWLHELWAGKAVWWLVQWPVLGHGHAHLGELISVRNRLGYSPF